MLISWSPCHTFSSLRRTEKHSKQIDNVEIMKHCAILQCSFPNSLMTDMLGNHGAEGRRRKRTSWWKWDSPILLSKYEELASGSPSWTISLNAFSKTSTAPSIDSVTTQTDHRGSDRNEPEMFLSFTIEYIHKFDMLSSRPGTLLDRGLQFCSGGSCMDEGSLADCTIWQAYRSWSTWPSSWLMCCGFNCTFLSCGAIW